MILRRVERVESIVNSIHIRSFVDGITHALKDFHYFIDNLGNRMFHTINDSSARLGYIDFFCLEFCFLCLFFYFNSFFRKQLFKLCFHFIRGLPQGLLFFWRKLSHRTENLRKLTLLSKDLNSYFFCVCQRRCLG